MAGLMWDFDKMVPINNSRSFSGNEVIVVEPFYDQDNPIKSDCFVCENDDCRKRPAPYHYMLDTSNKRLYRSASRLISPTDLGEKLNKDFNIKPKDMAFLTYCCSLECAKQKLARLRPQFKDLFPEEITEKLDY